MVIFRECQKIIIIIYCLAATTAMQWVFLIFGHRSYDDYHSYLFLQLQYLNQIRDMANFEQMKKYPVANSSRGHYIHIGHGVSDKWRLVVYTNKICHVNKVLFTVNCGWNWSNMGEFKCTLNLLNYATDNISKPDDLTPDDLTFTIKTWRSNLTWHLDPDDPFWNF